MEVRHVCFAVKRNRPVGECHEWSDDEGGGEKVGNPNLEHEGDCQTALAATIPNSGGRFQVYLRRITSSHADVASPLSAERGLLFELLPDRFSAGSM